MMYQKYCAGLCLALLCLFANPAGAGDLPSLSMTEREPAYVNTIEQRAAKIIDKAAIEDEAKKTWARQVLMELYFGLNDWQENNDAERKTLKPKENEADAQREEAIQAERVALRDRFVAALDRELTEAQATVIKDEISYGVRLNTYNVYLMYVPDMSDELKAMVMRELTEARDKAIMGTTSNEKHGHFGKHKGRINNALSAAGYNMKEQEKAYQERQKAQQAQGGQ